jgi:hypothetical protein
VGSRSPLPREQLFDFRGGQYGFVGVRLADYVPYARPISDSWDTVAVPTALFRQMARPVNELLYDRPADEAVTWPDWQEQPADLEWVV